MAATADICPQTMIVYYCYEAVASMCMAPKERNSYTLESSSIVHCVIGGDVSVRNIQRLSAVRLA